MGVYIENGKYKIRVRINGRLVRRVVGLVNPANRRTADAILREIKNEIAEAQLKGQPWLVIDKLQKAKHQPTFAEAAEQFMNESLSKKHSTIVTYKNILERYLLPKFAERKLHSITSKDLAEFQTSLVVTRSASGSGTILHQLSPRRVNNIMQLFRTILARCIRDGVIERNPAATIKRVQEPRAKIDPLAQDEVEDALKHLDSHYRPLFTILAFTGMRPNEAIALRWHDIDFRRKEINIDKGRVRGHEGLPKSESAHRVLPLVPRCETVLNELKSGKQQSGTLLSMDGYIFTNKKGQPIQKHLDVIWARALRAAGIRHRPCYQLRHTFASQCLLLGLSPGYVAKLLGHATLETMYRHYARWIEDASKLNERKLMEAFESPQRLIQQVSPKVSLTVIETEQAKATSTPS
jgi:integrase